VALNIDQLISALIGAVAGAGGTAAITAYTLHWQSRQAIAAEQCARDARVEDDRHTRDMTTTTTACENLIELLLLVRNPDQDREKALRHRMRKGETRDEIIADIGPPNDDLIEAWFSGRESLLLGVETAAGDISDHELRLRLDEACTLMRCYAGPESHARQYENRTRYIAASYGLKCISAYRRGDPLPDRPKSYRDTQGYVELYIEALGD
jgi:hypothetical protein